MGWGGRTSIDHVIPPQTESRSQMVPDSPGDRSFPDSTDKRQNFSSDKQQVPSVSHVSDNHWVSSDMEKDSLLSQHPHFLKIIS